MEHTPELFVREQRPGEHDFKIAYRMGPSASAGVAEVYGSNVGFGPKEAASLAHLFAAAPALLSALEGLMLFFQSGNEIPITRVVINANSEWVTKARAAILAAKGD